MTLIRGSEGGGSVDDGEVGVANFEFGLGFNEVCLEVVPGFVYLWELVPEA